MIYTKKKSKFTPMTLSLASLPVAQWLDDPTGVRKV